MARFTLPTPTTAQPAARPVFEAIAAKLGVLPNLYAYQGHSPEALQTYLDFCHAVEHAHFSNREAQAVYLAVSEVNACTYCLAAHTAIGQMNGFSEDETFSLRAGTSADARLGALTRLARALVEAKGRPDAALVDAFFAAGYGEPHLVDLVGLVAAKTFMNYLHNLVGEEAVPVDFPAARPLPADAVLA